MKPLSLSKPHLIVMVGIPGSGKTFFAEHFSNTFKAPFVNTNQLKVKLSEQDAINDSTIQRIGQYMLEELLKTKQTIIYEGQLNLRSERLAIAKKAKEAGYEPLFIWVQTDPITAKKRAVKQNKNLAPNEFDSILKHFNPPRAQEKAVVISGKHTYASQLKITLIRLAGSQPVARPQSIVPPRTAINRNITIR